MVGCLVQLLWRDSIFPFPQEMDGLENIRNSRKLNFETDSFKVYFYCLIFLNLFLYFFLNCVYVCARGLTAISLTNSALCHSENLE